nr:MAG TPA: hypothetical protein [Caudoviricetes sp.]
MPINRFFVFNQHFLTLIAVSRRIFYLIIMSAKIDD